MVTPDDAPPTLPGRWGARDAAIARLIRLTPGEPLPEKGTTPCHCGGRWRYRLLAGGRRSLWRCLHCGTLHLNGHAIDEGP